MRTLDFLSANNSVTQHHNKNTLNAVNNLNDNKNTRRHCEQHLLCPREVDLVFARTLNHRIVGVWHLSRGLFLSILGGAGYYINLFAFAVEGHNFYLIFFEAAVCIEGDAANVCHDFEVFEGSLLLCAGARLIFTLQYQGVLRKRVKQKIQWNFQDLRTVKIMSLQDLNFFEKSCSIPGGPILR